MALFACKIGGSEGTSYNWLIGKEFNCILGSSQTHQSVSSDCFLFCDGLLSIVANLSGTVPTAGSAGASVTFYDSGDSQISTQSLSRGSNTITIPSNASYFKLHMAVSCHATGSSGSARVTINSIT